MLVKINNNTKNFQKNNFNKNHIKNFQKNNFRKKFHKNYSPSYSGSYVFYEKKVTTLGNFLAFQSLY